MITTHSHNIPINNEDFQAKLSKELVAVRRGCCDGFNNCRICNSDYAIQWADVAITLLHQHKIITKTNRNRILAKLYSGHRG